MTKLPTKIKEELYALIPPTLFFFVGLHIVIFIQKLLLNGATITLGTSASVALTALIIGKAVIVADLLPFIDRFPEKPLIYNITWKTALYSIIATILHYLERLVDFWRETGGFISGNQKMAAEMIWSHFLAIQIILIVMVLIYCTGCELVRIFGREKMKTIFFG